MVEAETPGGAFLGGEIFETDVDSRRPEGATACQTRGQDGSRHWDSLRNLFGDHLSSMRPFRAPTGFGPICLIRTRCDRILNRWHEVTPDRSRAVIGMSEQHAADLDTPGTPAHQNGPRACRPRSPDWSWRPR